MDIGVNGYILKENAVEDVISSIEAVAAGQTYLSPGVSGHFTLFVSRQFSSDPPQFSSDPPQFSSDPPWEEV